MNNTLSTPFLVLSHDMVKMVSFTYVENVLIYFKTVGTYSESFKIIEIHLYSRASGSMLTMLAMKIMIKDKKKKKKHLQTCGSLVPKTVVCFIFPVFLNHIFYQFYFIIWIFSFPSSWPACSLFLVWNACLTPALTCFRVHLILVWWSHHIGSPCLSSYHSLLVVVLLLS